MLVRGEKSLRLNNKREEIVVQVKMTRKLQNRMMIGMSPFFLYSLQKDDEKIVENRIEHGYDEVDWRIGECESLT
jgi:hypothetical protein